MDRLHWILRFALLAGVAGGWLGVLTLLATLHVPQAAAQDPPIVVVTNTGDSGPGSLRQAILEVEPGGTIGFDPSLAGGTILLTSGQLVISQSLTIDASAAISLTIDGNRADRVFYIAEDTAVELVALTIAGGQAPVNDEETIGHGGGILNLGELTLTMCAVIDNQAGRGRPSHPQEPPNDPCPFVPAMPGGNGGGISNQGRLTLRETTVISNTAGAGGPGIGDDGCSAPGESGGNGGGIFSNGVLELIDATVQANRAGRGGMHMGPFAPPGDGGHGGGVYSTGIMTITRTLVTDNVAGRGYFPVWPFMQPPIAGSSGGDGGGIYNALSGRLALTESNVRGNTAGDGTTMTDHKGGSGGGLYSSGVAVIASSVFSANHAGASQRPCGDARGGDGGAIANHGTLMVDAAVLDGNSSGTGNQGGSGGAGGGLWNHGSAYVTDSAIANNVTSQGSDGLVAGIRGCATPGGAGGDGAGLWNDGSLTLTRVTIDGNQAGTGGLGGSQYAGAPYNHGLSGGNGGSGGGLWNKGLVVAAQTTISHNHAGAAGAGGVAQVLGGNGGRGGAGGGLYNQGVVALFNATVSADVAGSGGNGGSATLTDPHLCVGFPCRGGDGGPGGDGGGIYNSYSLSLDNCTLTGNSASLAGAGGQGATGGAGGLDGAGGGVYGAFSARDAILAGNDAPGGGLDCAGLLYTGSHNLLQNPAGCTIDPAVTNNVIGLSPALLPLALNAPGTTPTHALVWGSPAIDAGSCSAGSVTDDQRGVPRPQGAGCDIGAYEYEPDRWRLLWLPLMRIQ
jgi:hypothetical protein